MYAYRGEVYRRLGDHERARQDTRTMLEMTPNRISSWINWPNLSILSVLFQPATGYP